MNRLVLAFALLTALGAAAQTEPILRTEVGGHTGPIWGIATDAAGRYVVTAGDKTVRLWDVRNGTLVETFRPPIGVGAEGALSSVAITPDGDQIVTGGRTQLEGESANSLYVFQRIGGKMLSRPAGFRAAVHRLAFSPDGRFLAAMTIEGGISILRTGDFSSVGEDTACRGLGSMDVGPPARLVSVCDDGYVRLYSIEASGLRLLTERKKFDQGARPFSVKLSPDGKKLAVGFVSRPPRIDFVDAATLESEPGPDVRDAAGPLRLMAWSSDGATLYAGGWVSTIATSATQPFLGIRRWRGAAFKDLPGGQHYYGSGSVVSIAAMPQGGVVYGTFGGEWGYYDASDRRLVAFHARMQRGIDPGRTLELERLGDALAPWIKQEPNPSAEKPVPGLELDQFGLRARLNGRLLRLDQGEAWTEAILSPDGGSFVMATSLRLRAYGLDGRELWNRRVASSAHAPTFAKDGRFLNVLMGDGTQRWHRARDGEELLALAVHSDGKRWVLWTPRGYYMGSAGADDLIGWHVNRGRDEAADFYPASRFRSQFYRPDVLEKVLEAVDEGEALRLANIEAGRKEQAVRVQQVLPPVVTVLSPESGEAASGSPIVVKFSLRSPKDAPVTGLRVRVNGQSVDLAGARNLGVVSGETHEIAVPIPAADSEIMIFAENKNGTSAPGVTRVAWKGKAQDAEFSFKPKLYVLAIGVSEYNLKDIRLELAAKDARDFAQAVQKQKGSLYRDVEVRLLTDAAATRDDVVDGLEWLRRQVTAKDVGMVYLAGHGVNDADGKYYYLPVNADPDKLKRTGVVFTEIRDTLSALPGKAIFFVDTCHAGNVLGTGRRSAAVDVTSVVNELASAENGVLVFSASTGRQYSMENKNWGNGAFTKAVVEGLLGSADYNKNGRITHKMLDFYISERVKELTGNQQTPVTLVPQGVPDFPVAIVK